MNAYEDNGYEILPSVLDDSDLHLLRQEVDRLQGDAGTGCVRRIREKSQRIHALSRDERLLKLIPAGFEPIRSILFDKTPEENWPVAWHQDLTICLNERKDAGGFGPWSVKDGVTHVQPPVEILQSMTTLRVHLDDTPAENGALRVIAGSHLLGRLNKGQIESQALANEVTCGCQAGDILRMSPLILHASSRATAPDRRRILHFEYAPADCLPPQLSFGEG